jgi:transcriptional regulator with XRE-family HTH domain
MKPLGSDIVKRIDMSLKTGNSTRKDLYQGLGLATNALSNWEARGTVPAADIALKIADYLGVSVRWLITGEDEKNLSRDEFNVLAKYNSLTDENRLVVHATMDAMLSVVKGGEEETTA